MSITVKEEDGVTASFIRFDSLQLDHTAGGADVTFGIYNEDQNKIGDFEIYVPSTGSTDGLICEAHRMMCDVLRQWLYITDQNRQAYEKRADAESKEET